VARGGHGLRQGALVEVGGDEGHVRRDVAEHAGHGGALGARRVRVVDLEHRRAPQRLEAVGAGVEAGAEDDELGDPTGLVDDDVVDEARARHRRGTRARPAPVDDAADEVAQRRQPGRSRHERQRRAEEAAGEGIAEQAAIGGPCGLEGAEERHVLGRPAGVSLRHRVPRHSASRGRAATRAEPAGAPLTPGRGPPGARGG
jgi:hypothetical protein